MGEISSNTLRSDHVSNPAATYSANGVPGSIFENICLNFDDGSSIYNVVTPDVITSLNGSASALTYGATDTSFATFDALGLWQGPNGGGSTNAHADSTFTRATNPVYQGTGSGRLYYVWGTGSLIRQLSALPTTSQPSLPSNATFTMRVYGDNSGNTVRLALRDSEGEVFYTNLAHTINFTSWQQLTWPTINASPVTKFGGTGDGVITGATMQLDSIYFQAFRAI